MKFLLKKHILFVALLWVCFANAQDNAPQSHCGTKPPPQNWETQFQQLVANQTAKRPQQAYTIPVIFHIIHSGEPVGTFPNIPQNVVDIQMATLNNDFAGSGTYAANYPANAFATWAATANVSPASLDPNGRVAIANSNIQFCLATKDTNGNVLPEPGIERMDYNTMGWPNPLSFGNLNTFSTLFDTLITPQTIWDPTKYLNVWVSTNSFGLGGYAYYPAQSNLYGYLPPSEIGSATNDGIYCSTFDFGYDHILAHEAGHWLGLRHTWGDSLCGNDYCNDTPTAPVPTLGSPFYPYNVNSCAGSGNGVMFMNFMDYSDNLSKYMFTPDQVNRMQTAMANSPNRKDLGTHNLCSVQSLAVDPWFYLPNTICTGKGFTLTNQSIGWPAPSFTWSASGGTFNPSPQAVFPTIQFSAPGIYTITLTASNGTVSAYTRTISVTSPTLYFSSTSQTICPGGTASFTVDGVSSYTWQPGNVEDYVASFTPTASQTYTCEGMQVNKCSTSGIVEVIVSPCVGIETFTGNEISLQLYPNPARDLLNLQINTNGTSALIIELTDAVGRRIRSEKTTLTANTQLFPMDVSALEAGIYFIKAQTPQGFTSTQKFVKEK